MSELLKPLQTLETVAKFVVSRLIGGAWAETAEKCQPQAANIEYVSTWTEEEWADIA
jgi:hypothetical protein